MQSPSDTHMTTPGSVTQEAGREPSGCGLGANVDVLVCRAEWYYHVGAYQVRVCMIICTDIMAPCVPVVMLLKAFTYGNCVVTDSHRHNLALLLHDTPLFLFGVCSRSMFTRQCFFQWGLSPARAIALQPYCQGCHYCMQSSLFALTIPCNTWRWKTMQVLKHVLMVIGLLHVNLKLTGE